MGHHMIIWTSTNEALEFWSCKFGNQLLLWIPDSHSVTDSKSVRSTCLDFKDLEGIRPVHGPNSYVYDYRCI